MKSLIAPIFGIHATSDLAINSPTFFLRAQIFASCLFPRAGYRSVPRVLIAANRRGYARAGWDAQSLIEKNFFKRGQEQQHVGILAGIAHQSDAPDFSLHRTKAAGDFDVEFIK